MKKRTILVIITSLMSTLLFANGVGITNITQGHNLRLISTVIDVHVENQIAVTRTTQTFFNETDSTVNIQYAFPLKQDESAIQFKWLIDGFWYLANISENPDSSGGTPANSAAKFEQYLGETPLMFKIDQELPKGDTLTVELQYVSLLPYHSGGVSYSYPNNYDLIQNAPLLTQTFHFSLQSQRTIETLDLLSHVHDNLYNDGSFAEIGFYLNELPADEDIAVEYKLSLDELGLFDLSTFLPDSIVPDKGNRGFFAFIAEPNPDDNETIIQKTFTLIIDCSGSMKGEKMEQAKNAATFIVNNLNFGDQFNICNFSTEVEFFHSKHAEFNAATQIEALTYIDNLEAVGWTNISGALTESIKQYCTVSDSTANIIIFFTDGEPTVGLTETQDILDEVDKYIADLIAPISIFSFGIGNSINEQLLSLLSTKNNGLVDYLGDDEIEEKITTFYSIIKSPVLLETSVSFTPAVISHVHPQQFPNLYQGQQMLVVGRYNEAGTIGIALDGNAYQQPVHYHYSLTLSDENDLNKRFLPKIWAKMAIEDLLITYYNFDSESTEAQQIRQQVIAISIAFGVISPFTKYSGGDPTALDEDFDEIVEMTQHFELMGNYPNPFNPATTIRFRVTHPINEIATIKIYNTLGQLVRTLALQINSAGNYSVFWDGKLADGTTAPTGAYIYVIALNNTILSGKMTLMK
ncbi:MAG: VWA domain-containing protein [Candidatus Marinimicrobia bacterium]|nr:VWA domain-containing protein [Candidatus Neomarinimicrobiota bacterium]